MQLVIPEIVQNEVVEIVLQVSTQETDSWMLHQMKSYHSIDR